MTGTPARLRDERGMALLLAIVMVMMLAAVGSAAILAGQAETLIAANFREGCEALYVAEGAVARVVQDLALLSNWTPVLSGAASSSFADGSWLGVKTLPSGGTAVLCCGAGSLTADLQARGNGGGDWGTDTPQWQIYGWGPAASWLPGGGVRSDHYAAVWVADDAADGDGSAAVDSNGLVAVTAVALGPGGGRRWVRALAQRVPSNPPRVRLLSWVGSRW